MVYVVLYSYMKVVFWWIIYYSVCIFIKLIFFVWKIKIWYILVLIDCFFFLESLEIILYRYLLKRFFCDIFVSLVVMMFLE